jgi:UDP-N-acetylglucosamine 4,6-dehydratase/5-epimerase
MGDNISDKKFLITGGTGSFGNNMVQHLLISGAEEITIFSRDEKKQDDMRRKLKSDRLRFIIGDVRDEHSLKNAVKGIDYIFHAAALKQVPSCEFFPMEATKTNVHGSNNVCRLAAEHYVKKVVCLSTDKAVYPINAMGISKGLMEKVVLSHSLDRKNESDTKFCVTRYGNVVASRGSVIPLFIELAKAKKNLTVTNPNMTRFLMSLDDSVNLVKFAFEYANSGEICVQKAPGATIIDLSKAINELFDNPAPIRIIGTRHGEKLDEVLLSSEEASKSEEKDEFYIVPPDERDLNYSKYFHEGVTNEIPEPYTSRNTHQLNIEQIKSLVKKLFNIENRGK